MAETTMKKIYRCLECGAFFEEPEEVETSYEHYYGVGLGSYTPCAYSVCPHCRSENLETCHPNAEYLKELESEVSKLPGFVDSLEIDDILSDYESGCIEYDTAIDEVKEFINGRINRKGRRTEWI